MGVVLGPPRRAVAVWWRLLSATAWNPSLPTARTVGPNAAKSGTNAHPRACLQASELEWNLKSLMPTKALPAGPECRLKMLPQVISALCGMVGMSAWCHCLAPLLSWPRGQWVQTRPNDSPPLPAPLVGVRKSADFKLSPD